MLPIENSNAKKVFCYFEQLSKIPHGSGNMDTIAQFCADFAKELGLKYIRDDANNVVIFKDGTAGYEQSAPIILQGHLDMVCQKTPDCNIDFIKDGLDLYVDGDFIKARGTTLGADNGIAVAMVMAILKSDDIAHPPIEAVFTTDEEVGMIGARALDMSVLKGKRMINLDSETEGLVTVSCAGGSDFEINVPLKTAKKSGSIVTIEISGLKGGHSGVEIGKNRVNANMLAGRILNELKSFMPFDIISINGGDKANAIPNRCVITLCTKYADDVRLFVDSFYNNTLKDELFDREPNLKISAVTGEKGEYDVFTDNIKEKLIYTLLCVPNGITEMSASIEDLVETSLNLGVLMTSDNDITLHFALRSNKMSSLDFLEKRLCAFFDTIDFPYQTFGHYPAWQYRENSPLRDVFCKTFEEFSGKSATVAAIHAGLECGVFAGNIDNFDCISIGPEMNDVHTTKERLSISSTENLYALIIKILEKLK